ncbi:MAG: outer membrane beta-barrel protein [Bdellovibrionaceae bacterium]|nr:outer membrane beta-barrel protein [Pseudobdellovibrionaceae bacterium]MBX3035129.1 outer membrane beta-barrel protein [Pseudobdellovibrionaceae bacterium]
MNSSWVSAQSLPSGSFLLAQSDPDEAFDPFSDYSEFDEASDEEADINFFRNGRFFTVGLYGGMRQFTGNFAKQYKPGAAYGVTMTYFFDLRTAFAMSFLTGDHKVDFTTLQGTKHYTGNVSITSINFDFKYYFNTQNVTRGLADLNPYGLLGFSQNYRTYSLDNLGSLSRDQTMGVDLGAGLEIPLMRRRGFLGVQGSYHLVNFADESKEYVNSTERLDSLLSGDYYNLMLILGMNF